MSLKARMAMFEGGNAPLTPEAQAAKLRSAKEKEDQAVKIARARTARYNMTLRSMALKHVREASDQKRRDLAAVQTAKQRAAKYNMTSRALALVAGRNQRNVAEAFDPDVSPDVAKKVIKAAATHQMSSAAAMMDGSKSERQRLSAASDALGGPDAADMDTEGADGVRPEKMNGVRTSVTRTVSAAAKPMAAFATAVAGAAAAKKNDGDDDDDDDEGEAAKPAEPEEEEQQQPQPDDDDHDDDGGDDGDDGDGFVMDDLARAVAEGDEDGVNRAVLSDFLREHAPHRLRDVDALLKEHADDVDALFEKLVDEYPDPAEALVAGRAKALADAKRGDASEEQEDQQPEDGDDDDDDGELSAVEQARREAAAAERAEKEKIAKMSPEEREAYFAEQAAEEQHREKKDAMLKAQLGMYAKGGTKGHPVLAAAKRLSSSEKGEAKRLSGKLEKEEGKPKKKASVVGDGFILSGSKSRDSAGSKSRPGSTRQSSGGSKWAVNVQPQLLRERMKKAGVADKDIDELMAEESDML